MAPRCDVDVRECNLNIENIASKYSLRFIEIFSGFLKRGNQIERFYSRDNIHLSFSGIKRLLDKINTEVEIVTDFNTCTFQRRFQGNLNTNGFTARSDINAKTQRLSNNYQRSPMNDKWRPSTTSGQVSYSNGNVLPPCAICMKSNHATQDCRFQSNVCTNGFTARDIVNTNTPRLSNTYQRSTINDNRRPPTTSRQLSYSSGNVLPPYDSYRMTSHATQDCRFQGNLNTNGFTERGIVNVNMQETSNNNQSSPINNNRIPSLTSGHVPFRVTLFCRRVKHRTTTKVHR